MAATLQFDPLTETGTLGGRCYDTPAGRGLVPLDQAFRDIRDFTLGWSAMLSPEDQMVQSCQEASPVKWHLAHTTWFFETFLLREFLDGYQPLNADYLWLFNSYYNSISDQPVKSLRASFSRPSSDDILRYRSHVETNMAMLFQKLPELPVATAREISERIVIGLHHEQQHQELIAYDVKHAFWSNPLHPAVRAIQDVPPAIHHQNAPRWKSYSPGLVGIGHDADGFSFDNELPRHRYFVEDFSLATRLVTCAEYLQFIEAGGYQKSSLWLSDGWSAVNERSWKTPLYWKEVDGQWHIFTLHGLLPLIELETTPVCHVSYYEADAYARWAGARLPSEFEWESVAADHATEHAGLLTSAGLQYGFLHPTSHASLFGSVWQWTNSAYTPYPGYRPLEGALGEYNGKFMSGQMVLRGGSAVTPAGHLRKSYRNFFHPAMRWQFSGIRLASDGLIV